MIRGFTLSRRLPSRGNEATTVKTVYSVNASYLKRPLQRRLKGETKNIVELHADCGCRVSSQFLGDLSVQYECDTSALQSSEVL